VKTTLFALLLPISLLGLSPVNANTYSYNVDLVTNSETATVAGTIVTTCDNCVLLPANIISWSFTVNGSNGMSSSDGIGYVSVSFALTSPLTATASNITFDPLTLPISSYIEFGYPDLPNFTGEPSLVFQAEPGLSILYSVNVSSGVMEGVASSNLQSPIEIATLEAATPLPASLPLFAAGLAGLGLFGWRRKRKGAVPAA
jgi:hypothetical protein